MPFCKASIYLRCGEMGSQEEEWGEEDQKLFEEACVVGREWLSLWVHNLHGGDLEVAYG